MTISVIQESTATFTSAVSAANFSLTMGANTGSNFLHVVGICGNSNTLNTPTDNLSGSYTALGHVTDTVPSRTVYHWVRSATVGGALTITIAYGSFSDHQMFIWAREIGGSSGLDPVGQATITNGGQAQATPNVSPTNNGAQTGTFIPNSAPGLMSVIWVSPGGANTSTTGTGFTTGIANQNMAGQIGGIFSSEYERYTNTNSFSGNFTVSSPTGPVVTMGALFMEQAQSPFSYPDQYVVIQI